MQKLGRGHAFNSLPEERELHCELSKILDKRFKICAHEPIGPYIVDFYLYPLNVVVEIGENNRRSDRRRRTFLERKGIHVLRFTKEETGANPADVAARIITACGSLERAW